MFSEIYIGNVLESYYKSYINLPTVERKFWTKSDSLDNNRSLLYGHDHKVVITPHPINSVQIDFVSEITGWQNILNLSPQKPRNSICEDIFNDKKLWQKIIEIIKNNPQIKIIPYRQTPEFYQLINQLKSQKLNFSTPETPSDNNRFIETYFHSKRGFRHLWESLKLNKLDIQIPLGFICADLSEAIDAAFWLKTQGKNIVIKYNKGVQGVGLTYINYQQTPDNKNDFNKYLQNLLHDGIWQEPLIVVEERIEVDHRLLGGSPNVEMSIDESGKVRPEYSCQQLLSDEKTFIGVSFSPDVNRHPLIRIAYQAAKKYGEKLSQFGYRGYFDMDLVVSKTGHIYAIESNLRRTGGTHVHQIAQTLLGKNYWQKHFLIAKDVKIPTPSKTTPSQLFTKFKPYLYNPQTKSGVIIVNSDMVSVGVIPLIIVGPSHSYTTNLLRQIEC